MPGLLDSIIEAEPLGSADAWRRMVQGLSMDGMKWADQTAFGMKPRDDRLGLLPRYSEQEGLIAPEIVYSAARAMTAPRQAWEGNTQPMDAMNMAGLLVGGSAAPGLLSKPVMGEFGMTAYHGTPHKFPPTPDNPLGAFDAAKIGTGEGSQAYGHGLYLAENPGVAKGYSTQLSKSRPSVAQLSKLRDSTTKGSAEWQHYDDLIKNGQEHLYTVDLPDEHIGKMLDWDAPLSQQPESVRKALKAAGIGQKFHRDIYKYPATGGGLYRSLSDNIMRGRPNSDTAKMLSEAGIPGIKYLDQGSRNAAKSPYWKMVRESDGVTVREIVKDTKPDVPKGFRLEGPIDERSRNFVVFPGNEGLLKILGRE